MSCGIRNSLVGVFHWVFLGKGIISHTKICIEGQEEQKQNCGAGAVSIPPTALSFVVVSASEDTQGALAESIQHCCISEMRGGRFSQSSSEGKCEHLEVKEIELKILKSK